MIATNLYPPIIDSYMPTYGINDSEYRVYFSISKFSKNTGKVQVILKYQENNSVVPGFNNEIFDYVKNDNEFYINLKSKNPNFVFTSGKYYKLQLREYNMDTSEYSEWSTVCLLKGIEAATIQILSPLMGEANAISIVPLDTVEVIANIGNLSEKESLYYYQMDLYDNDTNKLIETSGQVYDNNLTISYLFLEKLVPYKNYKLTISICTASYYRQQQSFLFSYISDLETLDIDILINSEDEKGCLQILLDKENLEVGSYILQRASSLDGFRKWNDFYLFQKQFNNEKNIHTYDLNNQHEGSVMASISATIQGDYYVFEDYTVQSGVLYKYKLQKSESNGLRLAQSQSSDAALCLLDDAFLITKDFQLKVKYDSNVSNFKSNIVESKTDTIGGKYPIIRKNANSDYKSFQISGLIVAYDENGFSKDDWQKELKEDWDKQYYNKYQISASRDFIHEKEYRNKVEQFLQDGNLKLFRSTQEGNFLVRLMNITLTPKQELGRLIYSFQAEAYEMAECTIENYMKYNIIDSWSDADIKNIVLVDYDNRKLSLTITIPENAKTFNVYEYIDNIIKSEKLESENIICSLSKINSLTCVLSKAKNTGYLATINDESVYIFKDKEYNFYDIKNFTIKNIEQNAVLKIEADVDIQLKLKESDIFTSYSLYYNLGQFQIDANTNIIEEVDNIDIATDSNNIVRQTSKISAIVFNNFVANTDVIITIVFSSSTQQVVIKNNSSYTITDNLDKIQSITSNNKLYIDYYKIISEKIY